MSASTTSRPRPRASAAWAERFARAVTAMVLAAALYCLAATFLDETWPRAVRIGRAFFELFNIPVAANLFSAVALLVIASALAVHKRAALWVVMVGFQGGWLVVAAVVAVLRGVDAGSAIPKVLLDSRFDVGVFSTQIAMAVVLIPLLWWARRCFPARLAPSSLARGALHLAAGIMVAALTGLICTEADPGTLRGQHRIVVWPLRTALGFMPARDSPYYDGTGARWVGTVIGFLSAGALLWASAVVLRSARANRHLNPDDEVDLRRLLRDHGDADSLGYFATRRDKAVVFSPDRRAAITYCVEAGTMVASADPIGDPAAWPAAIEAWLATARQFGWVPAVLSASTRGAAAYRRAGLRVLGMGDEAIVEVEDFHLSNPALRQVRQAVTRVRRAGYQLSVRFHGDIDPTEMADLARAAETWRGDEPERGFSMALGRLGDPTDRRCVMVTAHDPSGALRAMLSFVPWGRAGVSLDLMRRDPGADNGVIEFCVCGLIGESRRLGISRISLNFAMFRGVFSAREQLGSGPILRLTAAALTVASRWWQIETLYRSNVKYLPQWNPRFICFTSVLQLNRAAIAAGIAEGFLPAPRLRDRHAHQPVAGAALCAAVIELDSEPRALTIGPPALGRQAEVRHDKLSALRASGIDAYPVAVARDTTVDEVRRRYPDLGPGTRTHHRVSVAGRVMARRHHGGIAFATLRDAGTDIQVMLARDLTSAEAWQRWRRSVDVGDIVSCTGDVVTTTTGELTVAVVDWTMAAKCLRPLPPARTGLADEETRVRQRHLDLMLDRGAATPLRQRSTVMATLRAELTRRSFLEVETPMLHAIQGGASARPFVTHANAADMSLYLRIAPELFLKRLAVGGVERVFELNRNFRNEGADATHNPEFTSLEAYQAYADYTDMRHLARELILACATAVHGAPVARRRGSDATIDEVDLSAPWPVVSVHQAVSHATGHRVDPDSDPATLRALCTRHGVAATFDASASTMVLALYEALVEPATTLPTFYTDFPVEVCPLTRPHRHDPRLAERWDLVAFGTELGTAYSELTDPVDQRLRLTRQAAAAAAGDTEAMRLDEDFLAALEYGMAPTGGLGLGVDRVVMLLTGGNIRSTLAFPFVRPTHAHRHGY